MARLDTGWHANPKVLKLGWAAMGLHAWSISYCDATRSDGFIPRGAWPSLAGGQAAMAALVQAGIWQPVERGFMLHDYLEYNRSRAQIDEYMAAKQAAGVAGGQASAQARARRHAQPNGQAGAQANGKQDLKQNSTPGPGPGDAGPSRGPSVSPLSPTPFPNPDGGRPLEAAPRGAAFPTPPDDVTEAMQRLYGPPIQPERLPNGAQQCPLCPEIFSGPYADHLQARHKVREVPDDLSDFHA